ncbi:penicillin acylase family protein [Alloalcanivorax sp. C16-2]|uniref:penicillin acylase family protein n=1 Tax=Alloalcanivorax sp. C16-2 TaxID=3390052 RepID=UPI00397072DD
MKTLFRPSMWSRGAVLGAAVILAACGGDSSSSSPSTDSDGYQATIERTTYGIPHITAETYGGAGYGHGYAIAEDNLCVLASAYVTFRGEGSRYFGPDAPAAPMGTFGSPTNKDADFFFRFVVNDDQVAMFRDAQPADVRELAQGFAAGFSRYVREVKGGEHGGRHLTCRDEPWLATITEQDVFRRLVALNLAASSSNQLAAIVNAQPPSSPSPTGLVRAAAEVPLDEHRFWVGGEEGIGSNTLAFGADATESGGGLLFANPHWYLEGVDRFYQLQMTIPGELNVSGVAIMGAPMVLLGFNNNIAWAHTVSTARRFTPYFLQMSDATHYMKDGQERALEAVEITIQKKQPDGSLVPETRTLYRSEYGPMVDYHNPQLPGWTNTTALTLRDINLENTQSFQNFLAFDQADSLDDFYAAIEEHVGIPWVNTTAIGRGDERALYSDITAVPNVPDSLVANCAMGMLASGLPLLNGTTSDCDWRQDPDAVLPGAFGPANLPHLFRRDYVANMNDSYWLTNANAPLTGYAGIIGQQDYQQSLRSRMGHTLVEDRFNSRDGFAGSQINSTRLRDIVLNSRVLSAELLKEPVLTAVCGGTLSADEQQACQVLQNWDNTGNLNAVGAHVWTAIHERLAAIEDLWAVPFDAQDPVHTPRGLNTGNSDVLTAVRQAFSDGVAEVVDNGDALDAPLSEVQTYAKADTDIPQYGGEGSEGYFTVLRNTYLHVVDFPEGEPVRAYTLLSHGVSTDPTSPHYADYTEAYSRKQWHRVPFTREQIENARISITEISE